MLGGTVHGRLAASNLLCEPRSPFAVRIVDYDVAPAPSGDAGFDVLVRADLAGIGRVAADLLRSPIACVPASVALTGELYRVVSAHRAADLCRALEDLATRLS